MRASWSGPQLYQFAHSLILFSPALFRIRKEESAKFRRRPKLFLLAMWAVFLLSVSLLYGVSAIPRCSGMWVLVFLVAVAFMVALTWAYGRIMLEVTETKKRIGYEFAAGEIQWDARAVILYPACCFVVGLAAAGLGVGGK